MPYIHTTAFTFDDSRDHGIYIRPKKNCDITIYRGDCSIKVTDCSTRIFQSFVINYASQLLVVAYSNATLLNVVHYSQYIKAKKCYNEH